MMLCFRVALLMFLVMGHLPRGKSIITKITDSTQSDPFKYSTADFVRCVNALPHSGWHLAFVGDSRIRQYFHYILKVFPDYDRKWEKNSFRKPRDVFHGSTNVTSELLNNLTVSFDWQPILDGSLMQIVNHWVEGSNKGNTPPNFLLIGISAHHMLKEHGNDHRGFEQRLVGLRSALETLVERRGTKVLWMNQPPTVDSIFASTDSHPALISADKLERYNSIARRIFKSNDNNTLVRIWDSYNHLAEEYVRSCFILNRSAPQRLNTWVDCKDYIHTGYSALSQSAHQLLLNEMCNSTVF